MKRVEDLEEEVALWELAVVVGQVVLHVGPVVHLWVDVLDGEPGPVRYRLGWHLLLAQHPLLAVEDRLEVDQLALVRSWEKVAAYRVWKEKGLGLPLRW